MEFKGTPAPWVHAEGNSLTETIGGAINGDGRTLCLILGKGIGKEMATANAKLIAAAPDLLDALIEMQRNGRKQGWNDNYESSMEKTRLAINKALGVNE